MKNKYFFLFVALLCSCQPVDCENGTQDGNETGIDCGGDCLPCIKEQQNPEELCNSQTFKNLQGEWYSVYNCIYSLQNSKKGGGDVVKGFISFNQNQVRFTTDDAKIGQVTDRNGNFGDVVPVIEATMYGSFDNSLILGKINKAYPEPNKYSFDCENNMLSTFTEVIRCDSKMILKSPTQISEWSRKHGKKPEIYSILEWKISTSNFPIEDMLEIHLLYNGKAMKILPIIPGETIYTTRWSANTQQTNNKYEAKLVNKGKKNVTNERFEIEGEIILGGLPLSKATLHSFCILGDNGQIPKECVDGYLAPREEMLLLDLTIEE